MKTHTKTLLAALTASAMIAGSTQAALITWTSKAGATDADIVNTGTLLEAANFGGVEVTANGVTFDAVSFPGGSYPLTNLSGLSYDGNGGDAYSGTSGDIDTILSTYSLDSPNQSPTLTGLTIGTEYTVQVFFYYNNSGRTLTVSSPGSAGAVLTANDAGIFTGTFTADATTQDMSWVESTGSNVTNGYQLRVVPEPGSLALLGLGSLLVASRRRRG